jgi:hypothetical protein
MGANSIRVFNSSQERETLDESQPGKVTASYPLESR